MNAILTQQMNEIQRVRGNTQRLLQAIHICNCIIFILRISRRIITATTAINSSKWHNEAIVETINNGIRVKCKQSIHTDISRFYVEKDNLLQSNFKLISNY